jgi:D-psicose/D-tagatose/L-ribulose 3-epimerase
MTKYGANAYIWIDDWTTKKGNYAIAEAGRLGFDFVEMSMMRPWEFEPKPHRKALKKAGIGATASLILPSKAHMPAHPKQARKFLFEVLEKMDEVGAYTLCGCIAMGGAVFTGFAPTDKERQVVIETLGEVVAKAKIYGIRVALECVNRYETYMYNLLSDGYATVKAIGTDNMDLHADTYHMNIEEDGYYQPLVAVGDALGYMHMSESHRGLIGTGTIDWASIFKALKEVNYSGPLVLESFSGTNPSLAAAAKLWRVSSQTPEFLAIEGLKFLREWSEKVGL